MSWLWAGCRRGAAGGRGRLWRRILARLRRACAAGSSCSQQITSLHVNISLIDWVRLQRRIAHHVQGETGETGTLAATAGRLGSE